MDPLQCRSNVVFCGEVESRGVCQHVIVLQNGTISLIVSHMVTSRVNLGRYASIGTTKSYVAPPIKLGVDWRNDNIGYMQQRNVRESPTIEVKPHVSGVRLDNFI